MLRRNGTAVDAAVAALICISVVNAQSAGIGGGFLMTLYDRQNQEASALLARETAPANASQDMFVDDPMEAQYGEIYGNIVTLLLDLSSDTHYLSYTTNYQSPVTPYTSHVIHQRPIGTHTFHMSAIIRHPSPSTYYLTSVIHCVSSVTHYPSRPSFYNVESMYVQSRAEVSGRTRVYHVQAGPG